MKKGNSTTKSNKRTGRNRAPGECLEHPEERGEDGGGGVEDEPGVRPGERGGPVVGGGRRRRRRQLLGLDGEAHPARAVPEAADEVVGLGLVELEGEASALAVVVDGVAGVAPVVPGLVHLHHVRLPRRVVEHCANTKKILLTTNPSKNEARICLPRPDLLGRSAGAREDCGERSKMRTEPVALVEGPVGLLPDGVVGVGRPVDGDLVGRRRRRQRRAGGQRDQQRGPRSSPPHHRPPEQLLLLTRIRENSQMCLCARAGVLEMGRAECGRKDLAETLAAVFKRGGTWGQGGGGGERRSEWLLL